MTTTNEDWAEERRMLWAALENRDEELAEAEAEVERLRAQLTELNEEGLRFDARHARLVEAAKRVNLFDCSEDCESWDEDGDMNPEKCDCGQWALHDALEALAGED